MASRRLTEIPEVVVVAEEYRTASAIAATLSWAKVVGIAAERAAPDAAVPPIPAVAGLDGLMAASTDDVLVLVDATRGVVLVDPDPIYLAQYTAEHDRVAPRHRLYLDDVHLPALTLDGRTIAVVAITEGRAVAEALASGPDGLYHALPLMFDPEELRRALAEAAATAAGKPLIVPYNPSLPLAPLLETASHTDITLAIAPGGGTAAPSGQDIAAVLAEIEAAQADCDQRDVLCDVPRLAAEVHVRAPGEWPAAEDLAAAVEDLAAAGVTRLILNGPVSGSSLDHVESLVAAASVNLLPVTVFVDDAELRQLAGSDEESAPAESFRLLIGAGVSGLLVPPELTQRAKLAIRETSVSEARRA
jgi:hypothetical protein